jgi:broad specificity phosphatase PhoE
MGAVYLIRHGQASFGASDYDQLCETGFLQSEVLGRALRERRAAPDAVFMGTMRRHRETAETCLRAGGYAFEPQALAGFDEFDHDEVLQRYLDEAPERQSLVADLSHDKNPRRRYQQAFSEAVARWVAGGKDADYAEPWPAFRRRCIEALDAVVQRLGPSRTAWVFTSGGVVTALCQPLLQIPDAHAFRLNLTLTNCGITKLIYGERGRYLSTLNEHSHFEAGDRRLITYR